LAPSGSIHAIVQECSVGAIAVLLVRRRPLLVCAGLGLVLAATASWSQSQSNSQFPGRRIGGGTRGECTSRLIAHLVPANNIQGVLPGQPVRLAVLQGPSVQTYPLLISVQGVRTYQLEPQPLGVRLLTLPPLTQNSRWESSYLCAPNSGASADPLSFITTASPPAQSLLQLGVASIPLLQQLAGKCGGSVPTAEVRNLFGGDPLPGEWPDQLPVSCQQL
jgi:hypothetical protein